MAASAATVAEAASAAVSAPVAASAATVAVAGSEVASAAAAASAVTEVEEPKARAHQAQAGVGAEAGLRHGGRMQR